MIIELYVKGCIHKTQFRFFCGPPLGRDSVGQLVPPFAHASGSLGPGWASLCLTLSCGGYKIEATEAALLGELGWGCGKTLVCLGDGGRACGWRQTGGLGDSLIQNLFSAGW